MREYLEYLRIPFKHQGRDWQGADCFGLVRIFYATEFGISLPDFADNYDEEWYTSHDFIMEHYREYGFTDIDGGAGWGDLLFFRSTTTTVGHIGIAIEDGNFLHMTIYGCGIGNYTTGPWRRLLHGVYRY